MLICFLVSYYEDNQADKALIGKLLYDDIKLIVELVVTHVSILVRKEIILF